MKLGYYNDVRLGLVIVVRSLHEGSPIAVSFLYIYLQTANSRRGGLTSGYKLG